MIDLSNRYLGLKLKSPLVASSSPLTESLENIRRLEEAGAAAVILPSIFEEQLALESNALDRDLSRGTESFAESLSYLPAYEDYRQGQDVYLEPDAARQRRVQHSCARQPEWGDGQRLGAVCQGDRAGGSGRAGVEYLFAGYRRQ